MRLEKVEGESETKGRDRKVGRSRKVYRKKVYFDGYVLIT